MRSMGSFVRFFRRFDQRLGRSLVSLFCVLLLGAAACSTVLQNQPPAPGVPASGVQYLGECSTLGVIACSAVSMLSGDVALEHRSTCTAYRAANGAKVETCGSVEATVPDPVQPRAVMPNRQTTGPRGNLLTWSKNSINETNFVVERCEQINFTEKKDNKTVSCAGNWNSIGTVSANVTEYIDNTAVVGQTYLYRVKAANKSGSSGYSNEAMITTPSR